MDRDRGPRIAVLQCTLHGLGGLEKYGVHVIEALAEHGAVDVVTEHEVDVRRVESAFNVDLSGARFLCDPRCSPKFSATGRLQSFQERRRAWRGYEEVTRPYDLVVGQTITLPWRSAARRSVLLSHGPVVRNLRLGQGRGGSGWRSLLSMHEREQRDICRRLESWTRIVSNSEYTRGWIRKLWGRESDVINPPIEVSTSASSADKMPWIVAVGFFHPPTDDQWSLKRHEVMIEAFKDLHDAGLAGWEFHLAGHALDDAPGRVYMDGLRRLAEGYPIHFHLNCPHAELAATLYRFGAIYWHATGYGLDDEHDLGRVESFGMSTAEAMAAGCVPVVIGRGGQPEIVQHGECGYLWNSLDELKRMTVYLSESPAERLRMSVAARERASRYGLNRFKEELRNIVDAELTAEGSMVV